MFYEISKNIFRIALPATVANATTMLAIIVNSYVLGAVNKENLYWLSAFLPVNYLLMAIFQVFSLATMALIALKTEQLKMTNYIACLLILVTVIFFVMAITLFFINPIHIAVIDNDGMIFKQFILFMIMANIPVCFTIILNSFAYAKDKTQLALTLTAAGCSMNCIMNYWLSHVLPISIFSLCLSITITYGIIFLITLNNKFYIKYNFFSATSFSLNKHDFAVVISAIKNIGSPVLLIYGVIFASLIIFNHILQLFGSEVVASFGLVFRVQAFVLVPAIAIGLAIGILINKAVAVNEYPEPVSILKVGMQLTSVAYLLISLTLYFIANKISCELTNDSQLQILISHCLKYFSISYIGLGPALTFLCVLEQTGYGIKSLLFNLLSFGSQIILGGISSWHYHNLDNFYKSAVFVNILFGLIVMLYAFYNKNYLQNISKVKGLIYG